MGAEAAAVDAAQLAARAWLADLDAGRYGETWDKASAVFRGAVPRDKWIADVTAVRESLGPLAGRTTETARYSRTLPGAPDGEYVVIQTSASFRQKKAATETITMMREPDGRWALAGYYIR